MGLGGVHGQASLSQDVLARFQGRERDGTVQVRPGADDDGSDVPVLDDLLPVLIDAGHTVLTGDGGARFGPAIAHGQQLHVLNGLEAGNVP